MANMAESPPAASTVLDVWSHVSRATSISRVVTPTASGPGATVGELRPSIKHCTGVRRISPRRSREDAAATARPLRTLRDGRDSPLTNEYNKEGPAAVLRDLRRGGGVVAVGSIGGAISYSAGACDMQ